MNKEINKLLERQQKEIKETKKQIEIIKEFGKKGIKIDNVLSPLDKRPTITIEIESLKEIKRILKAFKPIKLYYIDNTTTSDLNKWLNQKITMQDNKVLNGVEYHKQKNSFFEIDNNICINFENNRGQDKEIRITYKTEKYSLWIGFKQNLLNSKYLESYEELDTYETEKAREYDQRHHDIMKTNYFIKDTFASNDKGIIKISFYGGMKRHFSINKKGTARINKIFELVGK